MEGWTAIVMAGGKGVRMRTSKPKVLHDVAGVPMVRYPLKAADAAGITSVVIVVSPSNRDAIAEELGGDFEYAEQPEPLGTGHALAIAMERVPFSTRHILLLNGDMPLLTCETVQTLTALHVERQASLSLVTAVIPRSEAAGLGTLNRGARGKPLALTEASEAARSNEPVAEVGIGAYAFDSTWVRGAVAEITPRSSGEYYVTDLVARAVADGKRVEALAVPWADGPIGVNTRAQLAGSEKAWQGRLRDLAMEAGVTLIDPDTVYLDSTVVFEDDVTVWPNTSIRGNTHVGTGSAIGPNAQVRDAEIGRDVVIGAAIVDSATLDAGSHVGPFSSLRPGTHLEEGAYVGSHAEVKASRVGPRAHIGHFSYVGDAVVGADANIGAGAVTCNFDGVAKHVTEIGEGAFIGSGSMLVAPVRIGAGAVTGAGAVVTHDVAPGERVAGVPARRL